MNGWTVMWVGENAFRSTPSIRGQIEGLGFMVKVYRTHDKFCRMLSKKQPDMMPNYVFVISHEEVEPILAYFTERHVTSGAAPGSSAGAFRVVIEARSMAEAQGVSERLSFPENCMVTIAGSWEEVILSLHAMSSEISMQLLCAPAAMSKCIEPSVPSAETTLEASAGSGTALEESLPAGSGGWTLIWVSDQAFKPTATNLKVQLETLGGMVKGYKTNKNATRALDKKRALPRTVVLVVASEAPQFLTYLQGRPELADTRVVVESQSRAGHAALLPTTATCEIADGFEDAINVVRRIVSHPSFT